MRVTVEFLPTGERDRAGRRRPGLRHRLPAGDPLPLLGEAAELLPARRGGGPRVGRDYRVADDRGGAGGIYVQGATEHTHGITSTLLSNTAVRAGEIAASVAARLRAGTADSYAVS